MEKKNTGLIVLVVILCLLVGGLGGYIICDKVINKDNDIDNNVVKDIRINTEKDYVYDADYSYDNKYTEFVRKDGNDKVINIDRYGLSVSGRIGKQYLSDLKVPYLNINSDYAKASNEEIKKIYIEYAKDLMLVQKLIKIRLLVVHKYLHIRLLNIIISCLSLLFLQFKLLLNGY